MPNFSFLTKWEGYKDNDDDMKNDLNGWLDGKNNEDFFLHLHTFDYVFNFNDDDDQTNHFV